MTDRVLIQCGHSAEFPPFVPYGGGAPEEAAWTADLGRRLAARLQAAGVDTVLVGSWLTKPPGSTDWVERKPPAVVAEPFDIALCLHFDAAVYGDDNTGGFADRWELDTAAADADRFIAIWERLYPARTGIPLRNGRRNVNTSRYYAYKSIVVPPAILLEHGVGQGLDHATLFDRIDDVAAADAACILEYLGITHPEPEPDDMTDDQRQLLDLLAQRQITAPQALRDLYTWTDQTAIDVENLRAEVAGLTDQLKAAPLQSPADLVKVTVTRRGGQTQEVT